MDEKTVTTHKTTKLCRVGASLGRHAIYVGSDDPEKALQAVMDSLGFDVTLEVLDSREGKWVRYRVSPPLPRDWAGEGKFDPVTIINSGDGITSMEVEIQKDLLVVSSPADPVGK